MFVGEQRYKELSSKVRGGKIQMKSLLKDKQYTVNDRKAIYLIEEIIEYESR